MKALKTANTLGFLAIIILAFCPLITINVWDEPATTLNVIDLAFGPSDISDWRDYLSSMIKYTNLIIVILPAIGFLFSLSSESANGFYKAMIVCIVATLIEKHMLEKIVDSIETATFSFAFSTTEEIWYDAMTFINEGVLVISAVLLGYSLLKLFSVNMKKTNTPLIKKITCKNCGAINDNGAGFCIKCGKKLEQDIAVSHFKTCSSCGMENKEDAAFCIGCGNKFD